MTLSRAVGPPALDLFGEIGRHPFEVAVVSGSTVVARSLGSVLECHGYLVRIIDVSRDSGSLHRVAGADAVIIVAAPPRLPAVELCLRLHGDDAFDPTTPVLVVVAPDTTRNERLEVLSAGAWEATTEPLDGEILLLKLRGLMRMRRAVGRLSAQSLFDASTGLYTWDGLMRRSVEILALSVRRQKPLAVVSLSIDTELTRRGERSAPPSDLELVGRIWREAVRATDAVGKVGAWGLLCIAPDADAVGAQSILHRVRRFLTTSSSMSDAVGAHLSAGYCATAGAARLEVGAVDLLNRAVRRAREAPAGGTVGETV